MRVNLVALGIVSDPEADAPTRSAPTGCNATRSPLGRFGTPAEVVQTVLALLDAARGRPGRSGASDGDQGADQGTSVCVGRGGRDRIRGAMTNAAIKLS